MKTMLAALLLAALALMAAGCDLSAWLGSARLEKVEQAADEVEQAADEAEQAADEAETMAAEMQEIILSRIEKCIDPFVAEFSHYILSVSKDGDCPHLSEWASSAFAWLHAVDDLDSQLRRTDMAEADVVEAAVRLLDRWERLEHPFGAALNEAFRARPHRAALAAERTALDAAYVARTAAVQAMRAEGELVARAARSMAERAQRAEG